MFVPPDGAYSDIREVDRMRTLPRSKLPLLQAIDFFIMIAGDVGCSVNNRILTVMLQFYSSDFNTGWQFGFFRLFSIEL